ncbi:protein of unknown function [Hyphomicrobium sp. MC1]|nr:protein of unknown function [Hyphomicrobium sp. MC1]
MIPQLRKSNVGLWDNADHIPMAARLWVGASQRKRKSRSEGALSCRSINFNYDDEVLIFIISGAPMKKAQSIQLLKLHRTGRR